MKRASAIPRGRLFNPDTQVLGSDADCGTDFLDLLTSGGDPVIFDLAQDRGGDIGVGGNASLENASPDSGDLYPHPDRQIVHADIVKETLKQSYPREEEVVVFPTTHGIRGRGLVGILPIAFADEVLVSLYALPLSAGFLSWFLAKVEPVTIVPVSDGNGPSMLQPDSSPHSALRQGSEGQAGLYE